MEASAVWDALGRAPWVTALGFAASAVALVGFVYWVAELRRRPEVLFLWKVTASGRAEDMAEWPPDWRPVLERGCEVLVEASVRNVGDAPAQGVQSNVVVPLAVRCTGVYAKNPPREATVVGGGHSRTSTSGACPANTRA